MSYTLGRIGIVAQGTYEATKTYEKLDMVMCDGSSYIAMQETTGNLPTNTQYWMEAAHKGDAGPEGSAGSAGQSAYDSARAGGYTGTQVVFYADLASVQNLASALAAL